MSVCDQLLSNLAENYDAFGVDPAEMGWDDFVRQEEYGILALMSSPTSGYPPKLSSPAEVLRNVNSNFDASEYEAQIGEQEAQFLFALYQRSSAVVPEGIPISCELLNKIVQTAPDQIANIDWSSFEEGNESEESEGGEAPSQFTAPSFGGGFGATAGGLPPVQPSQNPSGTFAGLGALLGGLNTGAPTPAFGAQPNFGTPSGQLPPATSVAPSIMGGFPAQTGQPAPMGGFPAPSGGFGGFPPLTGQGVPSNPAAASSGKDLPYITVSVRGLKPSNESRVLAFKLTEADGNVVRVSLFITAGQVPTDFVETKFSSDEFDKSDNEQKSVIHNQNRRNVMKEQVMPMRLSNGLAEDGVCAQRVQGFELVEKINQALPGCAPDSNRPKSVRVPGAPMETPKSGPFGTNINTAAPPGGVVFSGFGGQPATGVGGFGQLTSGGTTATTMAPEVEPAGTIQIQVPNFDSLDGPMKIGYKIPGGPTPVAVSSDWYWYELPNGDIVKSKKKYLGMADKEWWNARHGPNQKEKFPTIRHRMAQMYGATYKDVQGTPTKTSSGPPPKSTSGRRKPATTIAPIPGFGGFTGGFPAAAPAFGGTQMPAVGTQPPTLQASAQPPIFGGNQPVPQQTFPSFAPQQPQGTNLFGQAQPPATGMPSFLTSLTGANPSAAPQQGQSGLLQSLVNQPPATGGGFGQPTIQTAIPPAQQGMTAAAAPNPFASLFGGPPGQPSLAPPIQSQPSTQSTVPTGQPQAKSGLSTLFGI